MLQFLQVLQARVCGQQGAAVHHPLCHRGEGDGQGPVMPSLFHLDGLSAYSELAFCLHPTRVGIHTVWFIRDSVKICLELSLKIFLQFL